MSEKNKFFTIMIVPEKTQNVRKVVIPAAVAKGAVATGAFVAVLALIMVLDYANVMNQITENKKLRVENRQLHQSVQEFKDKIVTIENTLDRVKTFATKLRIITNIEDQPASGPGSPASLPLPPTMPMPAPAAGGDKQSNATPATPEPKFAENKESRVSTSGMEADTDEDAAPMQPEQALDAESRRLLRKNLVASLMGDASTALTLSDADGSLFVKSEFEKLDKAWDEVDSFAEEQERETQYILEKLGEKHAIIAGTPTRMPTNGYITSDYNPRVSPTDGRRKMHEGIDIANHFGADVVAPANGIVMFSGMKSGYGRVIILDHGNGLETYYAHLSRAFIKEGDRVRRGDRIAAVGSSGHSTGPHLHYEVRAQGLPVDPCWYILDQPTGCRAR